MGVRGQKQQSEDFELATFNDVFLEVTGKGKGPSLYPYLFCLSEAGPRLVPAHHFQGSCRHVPFVPKRGR